MAPAPLYSALAGLVPGGFRLRPWDPSVRGDPLSTQVEQLELEGSAGYQQR